MFLRLFVTIYLARLLKPEMFWILHLPSLSGMVVIAVANMGIDGTTSRIHCAIFYSRDDFERLRGIFKIV